MITKINATIPFRARREISENEIKTAIIEQLPAHGRHIKSAVEVSEEAPFDYLEITQGDHVAKFVSWFVGEIMVAQNESYGDKEPTRWVFDAKGNKIKAPERKLDTEA